MNRNRFCGHYVWPMLLLALTWAASASATPRVVVANDNRGPAGVERDGVLTLVLRAGRGAWSPEGADGPALSIEAFGESDGSLQVPAPLIRVAEGTTIDVTIANELDAALQVHGWCARGGAACEALTVPPGATRHVRFASGPAGTYHYWATAIGAPVPFRELAGAFIVDPVGAPPPSDRVFVITEWSGLSTADLVAVVTADEPGEAFIARQPDLAFMVNGRSWPATERLTAQVGMREQWRVVNLSSQPHPMHLHGFYFDVESRGDGRREVRFDQARPHVVTEVVPPSGTMAMSWTPERPGRWLFHCHVMEHVSPLRRLPSGPGLHQSSELPAHHAHDDADPSLGMSGLVLGVDVMEPHGAPESAPAADPAVGPRRRLTLAMHAVSWHGEPATTNGFVLSEHGAAPSLPTSPGPPIVLTRGQPVEITLENHLREATAIHWHGMELESDYDGVHGWSGRGDYRAPMIPPGGQFVVRFTPPRAGTFIYHTHLHDHVQLSSGLYGALVVVDPDVAPYDPDTDHALVLGRGGLDSGRLRLPDQTTPIVLNGATAPRFVWKAGSTHRLRFVNITADDPLVIALRDARGPVSWRLVAKDGAALPAAAQAAEPARQALSVGETVDVEFDAPSGRAGLWIDVTSSSGKWELQGRVIVR